MKAEHFVVHVVDPDPAIADGLAMLLDTYGIGVCSYPDAESFLETWSHACPAHSCLLVEAELPGLSGLELMQKLLDEYADLPILLLISTSSPRLIEMAKSSRRFGVIEKPCVDGMLIEQILRLRKAA